MHLSWRLPLRLILLVAATSLVSGCDALGLAVGPSHRRSELERQRAKWSQRHVTSYRLTYRRACFCGNEFTSLTDIEVRSGDIAVARYTERDDPIPAYVQAGLPTVASLFAIIEDAIDRNADVLDVTYDPAFGYPRWIAIDHRFNVADDEVTHSVSDFAIILPFVVP